MSPSLSLPALALLLALVRYVAALTLRSTGGTLMLGDIPYYVPATPYTTVSVRALGRLQSVNGLSPVTVIGATAGNASVGSLGSILAAFATDDVWNPYFLQGRNLAAGSRCVARTIPDTAIETGVLVQQIGSGNGPTYPLASTSLPGFNQTSVILSVASNASAPIPNGPYFLSANGALYQPLRLYSDFAGAFTQPLVPGPDGSYAASPAALPGIQSPAIGVPSRLYYTRTASKPLAGVRTGIKDIYDIAGLKTSDGNRAWYGFYPPASANSVPVQRLIDAGAILVGKMKTSQFANGERATADWVDYHSPFNPRGDGYQDPSSSSSGAGAGAATYSWLDLTLGSDTGGSIRGPSQVQGLFGNRPSHGLVDLTGVMPLAPELDTAGFLCRDPSIWKAAGTALYADLPFYNTYPQTIQTLNFPTNASTQASGAALIFLAKLQGFLRAKTTTTLNLTASWTASKPAGAPATLAGLLNTTYPTLISKQQTRLVRDPFYAAYAAVHDGRRPFVDPAPLVRWAYGDSLPESALEQAQTNKTIFMTWFNSNILRNDSTTCSDSLLLYTGGSNTAYRNEYIQPPSVPFGFSTSRISVFAEVPDVVVPVGQASYRSTITNHTEVLPVTVDLLAAKGCDGMLFNLIQDLTAAGIPEIPQTGQTIAGGEILLKRGMVGL
ncbi:MAG: hypothetical protein LQ339_007155 [Xanthoria mediterranea]|nr:MAG: hypothetical protein LQ339_007155 [Xanthoria mediterranea]